MNNKGFIATSLIYSFFLVFVVMMLAILNGYIANKTLTNTYNEQIINEMNQKYFDIYLYLQNGTISGGKTVTNLISNHDFKKGLTGWIDEKNTYEMTTEGVLQGLAPDNPKLTLSTLGNYSGKYALFVSFSGDKDFSANFTNTSTNETKEFKSDKLRWNGTEINLDADNNFNQFYIKLDSESLTEDDIQRNYNINNIYDISLVKINNNEEFKEARRVYEETEGKLDFDKISFIKQSGVSTNQELKFTYSMDDGHIPTISCYNSIGNISGNQITISSVVNRAECYIK